MKHIESRQREGSLLSRFCSGAGLACTKTAERKRAATIPARIVMEVRNEVAPGRQIERMGVDGARGRRGGIEHRAAFVYMQLRPDGHVGSGVVPLHTIMRHRRWLYVVRRNRPDRAPASVFELMACRLEM